MQCMDNERKSSRIWPIKKAVGSIYGLSCISISKRGIYVFLNVFPSALAVVIMPEFCCFVVVVAIDWRSTLCDGHAVMISLLSEHWEWANEREKDNTNTNCAMAEVAIAIELYLRCDHSNKQIAKKNHHDVEQHKSRTLKTRIIVP